ncbi:helix-hairpin-helix domain-containing protein [Natronosalvus vescus]|uniref:helix-hairpin-helix domain-containing protein n=1 Tax=Natronosalvus vescus TaxID=2953881 RepID=UPI0020906089|nr:helix-hairpin-helix domain-containing protein [Natronosalvus vescus]
MGLLQKIQSLLGLDGNDTDSRSTDDRSVGVTVERERGEPTTADAGDLEEPAEPKSIGTAGESTANDEDEHEDVGVGVEGEAEDFDAGADEGQADKTESSAGDADVEDVVTEAESETDADADADESAAAGTSASSSTGSMTDVPDEPAEAVEPAEAAGPTTEDAVPETEKRPDESAGEPVTVIKGIGPAYADRLAEAGIETVADLAAGDADELEGTTDISATRIQGWIDRAKVR